MALTGLLKAPIDNLATLLSNSSTFQAVVGAGSAAAALNSIYKDSAIDGSHARPRAIVGAGPGREIDKVSTTGWRLTGPLSLILEFNVANDDLNDHNAAWATFAGNVESILDELIVLVNTAGYLNVVRFIEATPPMPGDPDWNGGTEWWFTEWHCEVEG